AILDMIDQQIERAVATYLADDYGAASFAEFASNRLGVEFEARDFRGASFDDASQIAHDEAESQAPSQVREAMEENLPSDAESSEWNWQTLASWANTRYGLSLKDKDLRRFASVSDGELELDRL